MNPTTEQGSTTVGKVRLWRHVATLFFYFVVPAASAIAPLAVIPAVSGRFGIDGWGAVALALGVGNAGLIIAEVGWGVVGPQRVAREEQARPAIYREALASKLAVVCVISPVCAVVAAVLAPAHAIAAAMIAAGSAAAALSPAWYFTGCGKPVRILLCETLPRVGLVLCAAALIAAGADPIVYGAALFISPLVTLGLAAAVAGVALIPTTTDLRGIPGTLRRQSVLALGRSISTVYTSLPSALLSVVSPGSVGVFAAADRPMRMGFVLLGAIPARLQAWIGVNDPALRRKRSITGILINSAVGVGAGVTFTLLMPVVAPVLFAGAVPVPDELCLTAGIIVLTMSVSRGLALALVAADRAASITTAVTAAAVAGLIAIPGLGLLAGALGAAFGVLIAEATGMAVQALILRQTWRAQRAGVSR